ncbi:MAG: hypoxanthine phosphoribosyltransferase [Mucilaginibacter polytrichastri]|nr:hypoxanthine phosphoribosyltransferase [Mucilaginibacter polytrichastri]
MTIQLADLTFEPFISAEDIQQRAGILGDKISLDYAGKTPLIIGVLNGSFMFLADLVKNIRLDCEIRFVRLSSYAGATETSGVVKEMLGLDDDLTGRDVIVVEDIVDTGITLAHLLEKLYAKEASSVSVASLLVKRAAMQREFAELHYVGFEIEPVFVVGYGLDYQELGRNLPAIYKLVK